MQSSLNQATDHDVYLYSVTEQIDTTSATGRFNFRNLASAAEFERDMNGRLCIAAAHHTGGCEWRGIPAPD